MKRILTCLLGIGLLLHDVAAAGGANMVKRIVDVYVEEEILMATSDAQTGGITKVEIINGSQQVVLTQQCGGGYSCEVNLSSLHSGNYVARVTTTRTTYNEEVVVQ